MCRQLRIAKGDSGALGVQAGIIENSRKQRLLVPIAAMTLGGLFLLVLLAMYLVTRFDDTASTREQSMVEHGFQHQLEEFDAMIVPQADWDKSVLKLDHSFHPDFADINFGVQFYTFNGFTRTFFVNGDGKLIYISVDGKQAGPEWFRPFADIARQLLVPIRRAEALRPPIRPSPSHNEVVTKPIQANGIVRVEGKVYVVIATLVQPDMGLILPKGPRAPVAICAKPIESALLTPFAAKYLVDDLKLVGSSAHARDQAYFSLRSPTGEEVAALAWTPRRPGSMLLNEMKLPLVAALVLLGMAGWNIVRRSGVILDELEASEARARHLAYHDPLTGLPNRAMLFERLSVLLARIAWDRQVLAVLCFDLDRFKEVNDTLGHPAGDALIRAVAERLLAACAEGTLVARLGGDEFVVIGLARDAQSVEMMANRSLAAILRPVDSEFGRMEVGCSIGVALIDGGEIEGKEIEPSAALRRADLALYRSKADGRACVTFFEPGMEEAHDARHKLEKDLRSAMGEGAFHMVYQPQVDRAGQIKAVEALLRWTHPELGEISPAVFVPLAEECGLITAIGEFVMRRVFEETGDWHHLRVAINVSAVQMRSHGFAAQVMQLVARAGVDPSRYEIELTETALLGDGPATQENYEVLRRLGFSIVLDDFGTGYSSLSLLQGFEVDKIKIDRSFVSSLGESDEAEALVTAIVKLAQTFDIGVIAEGVETEEQMARLLDAGCAEFQGFLTGRPMYAERIEDCFDLATASSRLAANH